MIILIVGIGVALLVMAVAVVVVTTLRMSRHDCDLMTANRSVSFLAISNT
jgi:hypothetical protein